MAMYATLAQARDAGVTGNDAEVTAAIEEASARVDRYTGDVFSQQALSMTVDVGRDGVALLRRRVVSVTSVRWAGTQNTLPASAYRVTTSATIGERDAIVLTGATAWSDVTVLGAEPWAGGYAALSGGRPSLHVDGQFGYATTPREVQRATALIARDIRAADETPEAGGTPETTVDAEGNVLPVVPPFTEAEQRPTVSVRGRTTGNAEADSLLASYVREPVRLRVS